MTTLVEWLEQEFVKLESTIGVHGQMYELLEQAREIQKEWMIDFGDFIIDELAPMAQNRDWVEEKYNYFISEEDD